MANLYRLGWFLLGWFLVAVPMLAFAGTYPATSNFYRQGTLKPAFSSPDAACQSYNFSGTFKSTEQTSPNEWNCVWTTNTYPNGTNYGGAFRSYSCPNGGDLNGQLCTKSCTAPEVLNSDGTCGIPAPSCPAAGTSGPSSGQSFGGSGSAPSFICSAGCSYNINISVGLGGQWSATAGGSAGSTCTTNTGTGTPPDDPKTKCVQQGMAFGTVNGQVVCVKPDTSKSSATTTKTPDPGSGQGASTTTTNTNTVCTNGSCTTTTTTNITSGGSGPGGTGTGATTTQSKTEDTQPQAKFCEDNPTSPFCKTGSFAGSCSKGAKPSCDGDAVQCAQAEAAWKLQCDLSTEPDDAAYLLGKSLAAGNPDPNGNPLDPSKITEINVGQVISDAAAQRTLTGQCIRSPSFTVMGKTFTLDVTLLCQFASVVGYLMVAAASIIATRTVTA